MPKFRTSWFSVFPLKGLQEVKDMPHHLEPVLISPPSSDRHVVFSLLFWPRKSQCSYPAFVCLWNAWNRLHGNMWAPCVCVCVAVNIDFSTSPSQCLSPTEEGGPVHTHFIQDSAKSCRGGRMFASRSGTEGGGAQAQSTTVCLTSSAVALRLGCW